MTIPANKKRFPISLLIGLLFSTLFVILIVDRLKKFNDNGYNNSIYLGVLIGLLIWSLVLTIFSFLDYLKTTFNNDAVLTINENGINDNLSIFSVGQINWTEITNIKIATALKTNFLVIHVTNPESFINRKSKLKQRPLKSFLKKFGSPVVISQKRVDYELNDLKEKLNNARLK